ncbi:agmatine coumaroyltransferase-2-like [Dorcoceras hygrometricum]|uniref:Agmatine coumaroyltransferase-2-like n=1 Tax=Dorcoceras hygrometricum TaxID=472368 RepID=A0A2Z7CAE8_9LAMI|nr:agmatine coumaroyltransferase-2-like [Dorcoceras hygrometricum]
MKVKTGSSRLIKPFYEETPPQTRSCIPLSVFDLVTYDQHVAIIYVYRPPIPSNMTVELGLRKALYVYREWAGRLHVDNEGNHVILLNDEGVRFVEASIDRALDHIMPIIPSTSLLCLHPSLEGVVELVQVQVTRFSCGSMAVGFTAHHFVADGHATSNFLVAWGLACRGLKIDPLPFHDREIFYPQNPPSFEFDHRGVEYISKTFKQIYPLIDHGIEDIVSYKVRFTSDFLSALKAKASSMRENAKPYSTFESIVAHVWRAITKARGMHASETTHVRISVDGRERLNPRVPKGYFGNLVLWAFAKSKVSNLLNEPLPYAAKLLHDAVASNSSVGDPDPPPGEAAEEHKKKPGYDQYENNNYS